MQSAYLKPAGGAPRQTREPPRCPAGEVERTASAAPAPSPRLPGAAENPQDVVSTFVTPRLPDPPVPVRTPAQVMRVWIAPWEDTDGDLVVTGYVYTEIRPRRSVVAY